MYRELRERGLEILAVNGYDRPELMQQYVREGGFTFPILLARQPEQKGRYPLAETYSVDAYPTNYIVDPAGRVVFRAIGFNEEVFRGVLARLGIPSPQAGRAPKRPLARPASFRGPARAR